MSLKILSPGPSFAAQYGQAVNDLARAVNGSSLDLNHFNTGLEGLKRLFRETGSSPSCGVAAYFSDVSPVSGSQEVRDVFLRKLVGLLPKEGEEIAGAAKRLQNNREIYDALYDLKAAYEHLERKRKAPLEEGGGSARKKVHKAVAKLELILLRSEYARKADVERAFLNFYYPHLVAFDPPLDETTRLFKSVEAVDDRDKPISLPILEIYTHHLIHMVYHSITGIPLTPTEDDILQPLRQWVKTNKTGPSTHNLSPQGQPKYLEEFAKAVRVGFRENPDYPIDPRAALSPPNTPPALSGDKAIETLPAATGLESTAQAQVSYDDSAKTLVSAPAVLDSDNGAEDPESDSDIRGDILYERKWDGGKFVDIPTPYRILKTLGRGSVGHVVLATDTTLQRKVAIKIRMTSVVNADEEAIAAKFPKHTAKIITIGVTPKKRSFTVMEDLSGKELKDVLEEVGSYPSLEAKKNLIDELLELFGTIHRGSVVHRDIKPENIMRLDEGGELKVIDFGLARSHLDGIGLKIPEGRMYGTPGYMSPEAWTEAHKHDGYRIDVFALSMVFFEILTGQLPHVIDESQKCVPKEWYDALMELYKDNDVIRPSRINPEIPTSIDDFVARGLSKDPTKRFKDIAEMLQAWRRLMGQEFDSTPPNPSEAITLPWYSMIWLWLVSILKNRLVGQKTKALEAKIK